MNIYTIDNDYKDLYIILYNENNEYSMIEIDENTK